MKKTFTGLLTVSMILVTAGLLLAQSQVSVTWSLSKSDTTSFTAVGNVMASAEDTAGLQIGYDNSLTPDYVQKFKPNASTSGSSGTGSWPQESMYNPQRYVEFSFGPKSGYDMTLDSLSMQIGDKGIKGLYADIYYSTSSTFSGARSIAENDSLVENGVIDTSLVGINPGGLHISVKDGQTLYLRVYPWLHASSTSTSKYMYLGNVVAYGTTTTATPVEKNPTMPSKFVLNQNYPNPFNPTTNITYVIPEKSMVTLKVYNVLGQVVETLVNREQAPGNYSVRFDGSNLTSGVYIYRLKAGSFAQSKQLTLIK